MNQTEDKELPLREDIRLLGRLLGDTVREQEGPEAFETIERIRRSSIAFHRDGDTTARAELEGQLDRLTADETMIVVRAFSYFSHLANIAEDLHHIRRSRAHQISGSAPREGSLPYALDRAATAGIAPAELEQFFRRCADRAGAHRASHRGAAQERARHGAQDRRAARAARSHAAHPRGARGQRRGGAPQRARAVADAHAAPPAPRGDRRGGQRHRVLRPHVPAGTAAPVRVARGRAGAPRHRDRGPAVVPAHGLVDRRRSRRQSVRDRRRAAACAAHAVGAHLHLVPRATARARRRHPRCHHRHRGIAGAAGPGRALARRASAACRRAVPPRAHRACTHAWPRRPASSTTWRRCAMRSATRHRTAASTSSRPTWT